MTITFILPAIGKKKNQKYIKTWRLMEPLTISTLKALTPDDINCQFFDDRIELINYDIKTDLVIIPIEAYTAKRAYIIAEQFRKKGVKVAAGGYHTTLMPNEVAQYVDTVFVGNAESVWTTFLADAKANQLKPKYIGKNGFQRGLYPDRSIYGNKKYSPMALVETGRGCAFNCEFCSIAASYHSTYHRRSIADIVEDIKRSNKKYFFFVDDNIVADEAYAIELFKALVPLKIKWSGQGSLNMAKNDTLLYWMRKSGCVVILIGYESLNEDNLFAMKKAWTLSVGERDKLTEKIHANGIGIYATFVFGYDYDTPETFARTLAFAQKHQFFFAAFNHLLPFPGTALHYRLLSQKTLNDQQWWLKSGYLYGDIPFSPSGQTAKQLSERCADLRRRFFSLGSIIKRGFTVLWRQKSLVLWFIFLSQNLNLKREVDEKLALPIGEGLDEWPK